MALTLTRVAHSTTLLDFNGQSILTDPWFSEKPGYYHGEPYGIALADLPPLTGVVASHDHYDHYDIVSFAVYPDKTVPIAVKTGMAAAALQAGFQNVTELEPWQTVQLGSVKVTATPGAHSVPDPTAPQPQDRHVSRGCGRFVFSAETACCRSNSLHVHRRVCARPPVAEVRRHATTVRYSGWSTRGQHVGSDPRSRRASLNLSACV